MKWSPQQDQALRLCSEWLDDPSSQLFYLAGFAGTGKTTLARELVSSRGNWRFAAYTGKAAYVLRQKGCSGAQTIHSLIYRPNGEKSDLRVTDLERRLAIARDAEQKALAAIPETQLPPHRTNDGIDFARLSAIHKLGETHGLSKIKREIESLEADLAIAKKNERRRPAFQLWDESPLRDADGVVIDECSMVDDEVGNDLLSFGKKILVLGDPAQLPPVGATGFFTNRTPDFLLTEVHRQAKESGILELATFVREGGDLYERARLRWSTPDCDVRLKGDHQDLRERVMAADQVLVGMNKTRHVHNRRMRELLGRTSPLPVASDRIISLVNDKSVGLLNGSMWRVTEAISESSDDLIGLDLNSDDDDQRRAVVSAWTHHFTGREAELKEMGWNRRDNTEMDYAYAITVHKAQGSQWSDVVLFDESRHFRGDSVQRSWTYTGITRAARKLLVIV